MIIENKKICKIEIILKLFLRKNYIYIKILLLIIMILINSIIICHFVIEIVVFLLLTILHTY